MVGDRSPDAREANLHDIDAKYRDVFGTEDAPGYPEGLQQTAGRRSRGVTGSFVGVEPE